MYTDFFGLKKLPFNLTPDPAFLFLPPKHREALAGLTYAIQDRKGFAVLTGDAGTGKTTLLNSVLSRIPPDRLASSILLNPTLSPSEFLESVLLDFEIPDVPQGKAQRLWKFGEFLARMHQQNKPVVLVIDEAHKLSHEVLEEIRLLGNFESAEQKFLQVVLLGQSELDDLLNREDLRQFKQRISLRLYIDRLTPAEIHQYIDFRWTKAGAAGKPPFTADAIAGIIQCSDGIPRLINSICDNSLLMAFADECPLVGLNYIRAAAQNLALAEVPTSAGAASFRAAALPEKPLDSARLLPAEAPAGPSIFAKPLNEPPMVPTFAHYGPSKANSSFLRRLAEKFGVSS